MLLKNQMKSLLKLLTISFVLITLSCVSIPNVESCTELASGRAFCKYLNSGTKRIISAEEWKIQRVGQLCHTPDDYGDILLLIQKQCEINKNCKKQMVEKIKKELEEIFAEVESLNLRGQ